MDNCYKDNKNRYIFCFWSLLVARRIVKEVVVSYMMVGHTHDDIDASFGRWSQRLRENDHPTLPSLMKSYMDLERDPFIPHLIEEVPDFKAFITPYIATKGNKLMGHSKGRQFKFTVDDNGWPIMQTKTSCIMTSWQPAEGIKLWKEDSEGRPVLPEGEPQAVRAHRMPMESEVLRGLEGYVKNWEKYLEEDVTKEQRDRISEYISYWDGVKNALQGELEEHGSDAVALKNGFWPRTRQAGDFATDFMQDGRTREELEADDPYIGVYDGRPPPTYNVALDAGEGFFLFVRPAHESVEPVWLGKAMNDPQWDPAEEHFREVLVQWHIPSGAGSNVQEQYSGWSTEKSFKWKVDRTTDVWDYISTDSIMASWKPGKENRGGFVIAPRKQIKFAADNLRRIEEREGGAT